MRRNSPEADRDSFGSIAISCSSSDHDCRGKQVLITATLLAVRTVVCIDFSTRLIDSLTIDVCCAGVQFQLEIDTSKIIEDVAAPRILDAFSTTDRLNPVLAQACSPLLNCINQSYESI